ncbi:hypothetical protein [Desulfosarcina ovata]|uniref:Uncharacterized protein n=1 Tax=Desulfosarcina ovata subsp. ovata TaxID=2752305 RepID=A0A5K8AJH8_9BACT|nr:hypothetical protein [Desulfosarcina ovata]BBO92666.1 hypothetical protein DSCOOX_58460 [Desulfosarcina ovata subsp. ovata]
MKKRLLMILAITLLTAIPGVRTDAGPRPAPPDTVQSAMAFKANANAFQIQTIDTSASPQRGTADAAVTIAVFSDFQ